MSQPRFLFANELSATGTVVMCSDKKFINVSHEKIDIKIDFAIFLKIRIEIDWTYRIVSTLPRYT